MTDAAEYQARRRQAAAPRRATAADREQVIDCLTAAFRDDPVMTWMSRKDSRRDAGRRAMFAYLVDQLGLRENSLWTTDDYSAAALWVPPARADLKQPFWRELMMLPAVISLTGLSGLGRVDVFRKIADAHHPKDKPHHYLMSIGVAPQFQGQGLGSTLLQATLRTVDADGLPAYLESSNAKNVPLYQRHGFEVISTFKPAPDGPPLWGMWRAARAA